MNKNNQTKSNEIQNNKLKPVKKSSIAMALLPLAACSGGGGGGGGTPAPPAPTPPAEFVEDPTAVFIARDDRDTVLEQGDATADLTVTGKGGDDIIHTGTGADTIDGGAGNDIIRAGDGIDNISGGSGNDAIVIVGTTGASEYDNADITNAGSGYDLSDLISLADLNDRAVSEVEAGEVIDGGSGTNILFIYGDVDLTGVTLTNVTILEVHSNVTLTPEQLAQFTTVDGDGNSVINIVIPEGSSDTYILDLSAMDVADIAGITIDGDITVIIDDESDVAGIANISSGDGDSLTLQVNGSGGETTVDLGNLGDTFDTIDTIELDSDVTVVVDSPADIIDLGLSGIEGTGTIETDGSGAVDTALDGITVDPAINGIPHAENDTDTTGENQIITVDVLANDSDIDDDPLTIHSVSVPFGEGIVNIVDNKIEYDPFGQLDYLDDDETTDVVVTYNNSDGQDTDEATLTITVTGSNDAPTMITDVGETTENLSKSFDVMANDYDVEDDDFYLVDTYLGNDPESPTLNRGSVSIVDGKVLFNPGTDFDYLEKDVTTQVYISYTVSDGDAENTASLIVTVTGTNDGPIATDDTSNAGENETISIDALANDDDVENDTLSISSVSVPGGKGSVSVVNGDIEFNPGTDFDGLAVGITEDVIISYTVSDGDKADGGSVTVTITGVNDAPDTMDDSDEILNTETSTVDVMANDSDPEGDSFTLTDATAPANKGSASVVDGEVFFDPGADFDALAPGVGEDVEITYTVSDGDKSNTGTLTVTVVGPNEAPVTVDDTASAGENETILVDVLADDTDADGHELSISAVSVPDGKGSVSVVDGKVQFDPGYDFDTLLLGESEDVVVTYTAYDGIDGTDGSLTITVNGDDDEPIAVDDEADIHEDATIYVDVLANDSDPLDTLELTSASTDKGTVTIEDGKIKYTADQDFADIGYGDTGTATVTYTVTGSTGQTEGTLTLSVTGKNDGPTAVNDSAEVNEGDIVIVDILDNDSDPNNDPLHIYSVENTSLLGNVYYFNGQLYFDTAGDFNYLDAGDEANIIINYNVIDAFGGTDSGQVTITVNGSNDSESITNTNFILYATDVYFPEDAMAGTFENVYLNRDTFIFGWEFDDTIVMGSGDDYVDGWDGADDMDGGLGFDMLGYTGSDTAVTVNLFTGFASGGFATGDTFTNFEGIEGSEYNDTLTGDSDINALYGYFGEDNLVGLDGDDYIEGGDGADTMDGGAGYDILSYIYSDAAVTINLATGDASGGDATGDTFSSFEDVYGSDFGDVITGDETANILIGFDGTDTLNGAGGNDVFFGYQFYNDEQDSFDGGEGYDGILFFGDSLSVPYTIDLSTLDATNIEIIDLHSSVNLERLQFSAQDIIDVTDADNTLMIFGGANDDFRTFSEWTYVEDFLYGEVTYSTYTSGSATIHVSRTIPEENMFLPNITNYTEVSTNNWEATGITGSQFLKPESDVSYTITDGSSYDEIMTGSGNDTIYLSKDGRHDNVNTGSGSDTIYADSTSHIDGGDGTDTIYMTEDLTFMALNGVASGGSIIINVENVEGNNQFNSVIGNDGINIINTYGGGDLVEGGGGADIIDGGEGSDTISYKTSSEGVNINLSTNIVSGGDAEGDIISNFENIEGSNFSDNLTGTNSANVINGNSGNDIIYGLDGDDDIEGNEGNDIIYGGNGNDKISAGTGNDTIYGGSGNDIIWTSSSGSDVVIAGSGDDYITSYGNDNVDGGEGEDKVVFGTRGIDYFELSISNIEIIHINYVTDLNFTLQDILDITDEDNELIINHGTSYQAHGYEIISTGQGWVQGADQVIDSETYHTYTAGDATLIVEADMTLDIY